MYICVCIQRVKDLTDIVWPAIRRLAGEELEKVCVCVHLCMHTKCVSHMCMHTKNEGFDGYSVACYSAVGWRGA
jgi:hypothetical protein